MYKAMIAGLLAATLVPTIAQAQNAELRHDRRDIRDDRRDIRDERRDVARDYRRGASPERIRDDRHDVRDARRDYREDWRDYRGRHPDLYRGPAWVGPRGYRWRPVTVGYRFEPVFYDRRYWIDPYRYHLRPVRGYERWVRYGRDVLLIDTRNGRVIEVNNGFFF